MNAREYYQSVLSAIHESPYVVATDLQFREIDSNECYIRGRLTIVNSIELHIAEYVITEPSVQRTKYRYHLQKTDGQLICRWDNVPHHPQVPTFPHHQHLASGQIEPSASMDIVDVLRILVQYLDE
ncbi:hypothetical protein GC175_12180 [bacterium]|nr:hypothetical protein [bacterium]